MVNENYTDIEIILDASGSMGTIRNDMLGVVNSFVEGMKTNCAGKCTLSLTKFYGRHVEKVWTFMPLKDVPVLAKEQYIVSGGTPLLDAIGRSIFETKTFISSLFEEDRPARILKIVITDGEENASTQYSALYIKQLISECKETGNWEFQFLGSGSDSFLDAVSIGLDENNYTQWKSTKLGTNVTGSVLTNSTVAYSAGERNAFVNMQLKYDEALSSAELNDSN